MVLIVSVTEGDGYGAETVLEELLFLAKEKKVPLCIMAPQKTKISRVTQQLGIPILELNMRDALSSIYTSVVQNINKIPNCDVVHGWTSRTFDICYFISKLKRVPFTCTLHDHPRAEYERKRRHFLIRIFANKSEHVICVSKAVENACRESGINNKVSTIRTGLIDKQYKKEKSHTPIRIGFLGMRSKKRGFPIIRDWIKELADLNLVWFLYGDVAPEIRTSVHTLVTEFPGKVILRGNCKRDLIYGEIDILAHASMMFDSLPTVLIEAAMAGIPSIGTELGGAPEIIVNKKTGFTFDISNSKEGLNAIRSLYLDNALREKMGVAAREHYLKCFSGEKMLNKYIELWASVTKYI